MGVRHSVQWRSSKHRVRSAPYYLPPVHYPASRPFPLRLELFAAIFIASLILALLAGA